jgi:hypothetical protein
MSPRYIACIADAVHSRALAPRARARLQTDLRAALRDLNRVHRAALAARFALTAGDELQCLLRHPAAVWDVAHHIRCAFPQVDWIVACGLGPIATALTPGITAPEVDGPCFHEARTALAAAKRERRVFAFGGFPPVVAGWAAYYAALYWKWTRVQRRAAALWRWSAATGAPARSPAASRAARPPRRDPSAWSHLRRRMAWPLVAAGDRMFRAALEEIR